jgi:hypothetical protein
MTTYYLDADGDGHAGNISTTICGSPPAKYITGPVDDCYDANPDAFPGQTKWFDVHRGDGSFDYDCLNGEEPKVVKGDLIGCLSCDASCGCATGEFAKTTPPCGPRFDGRSCDSVQWGCQLYPAEKAQYCR